MRTSLSSFGLPLLSLLAIVVAQVACGGRVDGVPSGSTTSTPGSSTEPTPGGGGSSSGGSTGNGPGSAPSDPTESCEATAVCDEGHAIVQGCPKNADTACYTRTSCGQSFVCAGPKGLCEDPECLGYTQEVTACPAGSTCVVQHVCDRALICEKTDGQCDGLAACDEADEEVASATECAKFASRCYSRAECGHRTYCVRAP